MPLLQLNRSDYYYQRKPAVSGEDIDLMTKIDEIYTRYPFYGVRKITRELGSVNHKRIYHLMRLMGIQAICPKPDLSKPAKDHQVYPYLLDGLAIKYPNQVWGVDITYIRIAHDWLYLVAIIDWYSRYVLAWELSDSLAKESFKTRYS